MTDISAAEYLIRNCTIAFKCKAKWEDLPDDGIKTVRFCEDCQKEVHLCTSDNDLAEAMRDNLCVAIQIMPNKADRPFLGILRFNPQD